MGEISNDTENLAEIANEALKIIDDVYANISEQVEKDLIKIEPDLLIPNEETPPTSSENNLANDENSIIENTTVENTVVENTAVEDNVTENTLIESTMVETIVALEEQSNQPEVDTVLEATLETPAPVEDKIEPVIEEAQVEALIETEPVVEVINNVEAIVESVPVETEVMTTSEALVEPPAQPEPESDQLQTPIVESTTSDSTEQAEASLNEENSTEPTNTNSSNIIRTKKGRIIELPKQEPPAFMLVKLRKVTNINYTY
jgi:hypothetical protein